MKRVFKIIGGLVILFVLFYGIPQLVNHKAPYFGFEQGSIGTKDLLVYYGDVLCAVGAFVGIFFTAHFAQRQYRKDEINRVRPYLSLTYLHAKSKVNPLELLNQAEEPREEDWTYKEEKLNRIFVILENDCIVYKDDLTPSQQKIVEQGGLRWKRQSNSAMQLVSEDYLSCPIEAYNVGSGAMVNLQFGFYHNGGTRRGVSFYTLKPNDNIYLHLFSDALDETACGDYILEFTYSDILGTKYSQKFPFTIKKQQGKNGYVSTIDFSGEQIRI